VSPLGAAHWVLQVLAVKWQELELEVQVRVLL